MSIIETIKKAAGTMTGVGRPSPADIVRLVRPRKAHLFRFRDDGSIPNNPILPLILYRSPAELRGRADPAAVFEELFKLYGWGRSWRNGVYHFPHYHSRTHEVLGVARGGAKLRLGGKTGRKFDVRAGDVAILPAGTGHECLAEDKAFLAVGAYPQEGVYDLHRGSAREREHALGTIPFVPVPSMDPVYGERGLPAAWGK